MQVPFQQSPNYKKGRRSPSVTHLVIHTMQGSFQGTKSWFLNYKAQVSAHYLVSKKGELLQMVKEEDTAWHVCLANPFTIGIELEDLSWSKDSRGRNVEMTSQNDPSWFTITQLDVTAQLAADICKRHNIPLKNVIGHNDPFLKGYGNNHFDPGPYFDFDKFRSMVQKKLDAMNPPKTSGDSSNAGS